MVTERPLPAFLTVAPPSPSDEEQTEAHYHGHRARLRARFLAGPPEALADYELVEVLLFGALPRRDVKPLAKALLARFGGFSALLAATPRQLRAEGLGESVICALKAARAAGLRLARAEVSHSPVLSTGRVLLDYCLARLQHEPREIFHILFLDRKNRLIADEIQSEGTLDQASVYPREVIRRALELSAAALILVHNHPSGDPTPSAADIQITRELADIAKRLGIVIHDHLVVGRGRHASFKAAGLL